MQHDREHWQKMLPIIEAFAREKVIKVGNMESSKDASFTFMEPPEDYKIIEPVNKWLETGWVKLKKNDTMLQIIGYSLAGKQYYVEEWFDEEDMEKHYEPCQSPIGVTD